MKVAAMALGTLVLFSALGNFYAKNLGEIDNKASNDLWKEKGVVNLQEKYPWYCAGFDEDGRPVWVIELGKFDFQSIVCGNALKNQKELAAHYDDMICRIQKSIKIMNTKEKPVKGWGFIVDMNGFDNTQLTSIGNLAYTLTLANKWNKATKNMDYGFYINMDYISDLVFRVLKPSLGNLLKKTEFFKKDKNQWLPAILKRIPKRSLPKPYGGYDNFTAYPVDKC